MEKIVDELKGILRFKDTTDEGDIVLIVAKEPQMLAYAHVGNIERDSSRKDEWWHVKMKILSIPLQEVTWTLRTEQLTGQEIFTMGGEERFIKAVDFNSANENLSSKSSSGGKKGKISPLKRVK
ncbi:MAG: hypothetical protein GY786_12345 [Proteobacteria bacterium]|nr:hypothetical protein [Pseudomonadota bacterium]